MIYLCPITGELNFDFLDKVVSLKVLHCQDTIFPFVVNKHLEGKISFSNSGDD